MAKQTVVDAAGNYPQLSTLTTAIKGAGLTDQLNSAQDITVFAPNDTAFSALKRTTLTKLLANPSQLGDVLTLHVVPGRIAPDQLDGSHKTLNGKTITVSGSGEDFTVNGEAKVVCGNVQTANATVYVIDRVLMPS